MTSHRLALERVRSAEPFIAPDHRVLTPICALPPPFGLLDRQRLGGMAWLGNGDRCATMLHFLRQRCIAVWNRSKVFRTCAVVGSGAGLRGVGLGSAIDAHEMVIRFNGAPLLPHDTGGRTTLRISTHSPWRHWRRERDVSRSGPLALYCHNPWLGSCWADALGSNNATASSRQEPSQSAGGRSSTARVTVINPELVAETAALLGAREAKSRSRALPPTSGMLGIAVALSACNAATPVDVYGFGEPLANDEATSRQCDHYWECRTEQASYFGRAGSSSAGDGRRAFVAHDWAAQARALDWLEAVGAIRTHARRSGFSLPKGRLKISTR